MQSEFSCDERMQSMCMENKVLLYHLWNPEVVGGDNGVDSFPVVFGSTEIRIAAVYTILEQNGSSHQLYLCFHVHKLGTE